MKAGTVIAAGSAGAAALAAAVFAEGYRYTFCRNYSPLTGMLFDKSGHDDDFYTFRNRYADYFRTRPHTEYTIISADSNVLHGYYYQAGEKPSGLIAFIIHGYRSEHNETAGQFYDYYMSRGIDIFTCDHTAHGESEGEFIGYGMKESRDCLQWIDFLRANFGSDIRICLHGFSMGGATVLMMSDQCPENVKFIVEDSGYADIRSVISGSLGGLYAPYRKISKLLAGYDPEDVDVRPHLAGTTIPMLFVHGKLDKFVPFENGPELYRLCPSEKERLYPENARHVESWYRAQREYISLLDTYLARYFTKDAASGEE